MDIKRAKAVLWAVYGLFLILFVVSAIWEKPFVPLLVGLAGALLFPFIIRKLGFPPPDASIFTPPSEIARRVKRARIIGDGLFIASIALIVTPVIAVRLLGRPTMFFDTLYFACCGAMFVLGAGFGLYALFLNYKDVRQNIRDKKKLEEARH